MSDRPQILALANDLASWWGKGRVLAALKVWGPSGSLQALRAAVAREEAIDGLCERLAQSPRFGGGRAAFFMDTARSLSVPVAELARLVEGELVQDAKPDAFTGHLAPRGWAPCAPISLWSWALGPWQEVEVYASKRTKPAYADWAHPSTWLNGERWLDTAEPDHDDSWDRYRYDPDTLEGA